MTNIEPIDDEWLRDIKGLAYRDQDGPQVGVSRGGMKRLLARLEAAESQLAAAEAVRGEQSAALMGESAEEPPEASQQPQVMSLELEARTKKFKVEAVYRLVPDGGIPAHAPPICIAGQIPMMLKSYEHRLAVYVCEHCQQKVVIGDGGA